MIKPETLRLKRLLAELGIPRGENTVDGRSSTAVMTTDTARRIAVDHTDEIAAAGYTVISKTYRCGCPELVWLCGSSNPSLRRTVLDLRHDCPVGGEDLPVTPDRLADDQAGG